MSTVFREVKQKLQFKCTQSADFPAHVHDDIELVYVRRGSSAAYCDGRKYVLTEGDCFLVFPNQIHHYTDCVPGEYIVLILKPDRLLRYSDAFSNGQPEFAVWDAADSSVVFLLEQALREFLQDGDSSTMDDYLTLIFGKLLRHYRIVCGPVSRDCVLSILQYCSQHYSENLSIDILTEQLHISRSHISHIFSSRLNIGFCEYVNSLRLSAAMPLLESGNHTVTEVSAQAGFPTIRTFNRVFRRKYGISPSQYRKSHNRQNLS